MFFSGVKINIAIYTYIFLYIDLALNLFFNDGLFDNSCVIFNDCTDGLLWANQLFDFYLKKSIKII